MIDPLRNRDAFSPSCDQVLDVCKATWDLLDDTMLAGDRLGRRPRDRESRILPLFLCLSEALVAVRTDDPPRGWAEPEPVIRSLGLIAGHFQVLANHWGWTEAGSPITREAVEHRRRVYEAEIEKPLFEAAISLANFRPKSAWPEGLNPIVAEGLSRHFRATLNFEEAEIAYPLALARWEEGSILGGGKIQWPEGLKDELIEAFATLRSWVDNEGFKAELSARLDGDDPRSRRREFVTPVARLEFSCTTQEIRSDAMNAMASLSGLRMAAAREKIHGRGRGQNQHVTTSLFEPVWMMIEDLRDRGFTFGTTRTLDFVNTPFDRGSSEERELISIYLDLHRYLTEIVDHETHRPEPDQFPSIGDDYLLRFKDVADRLRMIASSIPHDSRNAHTNPDADSPAELISDPSSGKASSPSSPTRTLVEPPTPTTSDPLSVKVDGDHSCAILCKIVYSLKHDAALFVHELIQANFNTVSFAKLKKKHPELESSVVTRVVDGMPPEIRRLIDGRGKGQPMRLSREKLDKLRAQ